MSGETQGSDPTASPPPRRPGRDPEPSAPLLTLDSRAGRLALAASILGSSLPFVDGTAVNVALPAMAADLGVNFAGFQWILNAYLIALAALVLPGGSLADRWGRRRAFVVGVIGFGMASIACGLAPDQGTLIVARALQGIAAAVLVPASLSLIQAGFVPADRGKAVGLWSGLSGLSTLIGPLVGGWLVDTASWRWVFWLNVPVGILAILVVLRAVPRDRAGRRVPLDTPGAVMAAGMLGGLTFGLTQGPEWGWGHPAVLAALVLGVFATLGFVDAERNAVSPMLPLRFFRKRSFVGANGVTLGLYFALSGTFFLLTIQLQRVLGYSALGSGLALSPITGILLVVSPLAGRWAGAKGPRPPLVVGPMVASAGALLLSRIGVNANYVRDVLPGVIVWGFGLALSVAPVTAAALAAVDEGYSGVAAGVNNALARAAQLLAVPLLPLLAGLSGIETVGGATFSAGFQAACRVNAIVLLGASAVGFVVLEKGLGLAETDASTGPAVN